MSNLRESVFADPDSATRDVRRMMHEMSLKGRPTRSDDGDTLSRVEKATSEATRWTERQRDAHTTPE